MNEINQQAEQIDKLDGILKPKIYSKRAIWGFSVFFSSIFGGILLMQNLKDIGKRKQANIVLIVSILLTALTVVIVVVSGIKDRSVGFICNIVSAAILTELFFKKYIPDEIEYDKKKIWKPLIIGLVIFGAFIFLELWGQNQTF